MVWRVILSDEVFHLAGLCATSGNGGLVDLQREPADRLKKTWI